jgi:hypothetical protein
MKRKKRKLTPEERAELAEHEARSAETDRLLLERIDYHMSKLKEEHGWDRIPTREEFLADYEAKLRKRIAERQAAEGGAQA